MKEAIDFQRGHGPYVENRCWQKIPASVSVGTAKKLHRISLTNSCSIPGRNFPNVSKV